MKKIVVVLSALIALTATAAETKRVCIDKIAKDGKVLVGKDGKPQQDCREMKVHKKLEGTKVPEKK